MAAKPRSVVVIHRHQLLYLMKEVLIVCPEDGLRNNERTGREFLDRLGRALLMANSLLPIGLPEIDGETDERKRLRLLAVYSTSIIGPR